jgi:alginate O-acetyltransferase complex protein AlgJ
MRLPLFSVCLSFLLAWVSRADATALSALALMAGEGPVVGRAGWLHFSGELRHLATPASVFAAPRAEGGDPVGAIRGLHQQLKERGVRLVVMPVPAKASVHPEGLPEGVAGPGGVTDPALATLLPALAAAGVEVLDLGTVFRSPAGPLYCRQDTHWNGHGIGLAAQALARHLRQTPDLLPPAPADLPQTETLRLEMQGDLWTAHPEPRPAPETIELTRVPGLDLKRADSPLLLLGDSHLLVFSAGGDMHATGAGFPEQLARAVGVVPEVLAVRGSGALVTRDLARRIARDSAWLAGKRVVVWVFTSRETTQGAGSAWRPLTLPGRSP